MRDPSNITCNYASDFNNVTCTRDCELVYVYRRKTCKCFDGENFSHSRVSKVIVFPAILSQACSSPCMKGKSLAWELRSEFR